MKWQFNQMIPKVPVCLKAAAMKSKIIAGWRKALSKSFQYRTSSLWSGVFSDFSIFPAPAALSSMLATLTLFLHKNGALLKSTI